MRVAEKLLAYIKLGVINNAEAYFIIIIVEELQ